MSRFNELLFQQKSRKKTRAGDIFVLKPRENLYYYGKVIKTDVQSANPFLQGMNLVYIYNFSTPSLEISFSGMKDSELLFSPFVTNNRGWLDGYFVTIANDEVTLDESGIDFGYWDSIKKKFKNEKGEVLDREPRYVSGYGLVSYGGIGRYLDKTLRGDTPNM